MFFLCLYRSPSQGREEFESFRTNFDLFFSNINNLSPGCSIITGDFNARFTKWWKLHKENFEGRDIKSKLVWLDIANIFISNPNLINSSGSEMSLFEKCHHNIMYGKIDFKILIPPPYMREVWDYKNASAECIQCSVSSIDWTFYSGENLSAKRLAYLISV